VRGYSRELVAIDEKSGARTHLPTDLPIVELAMAPQTKRALVALATFEDGPQVYSVVATLDAEDGHEYVRQPWEVMHLRGLDCTPEGETFVCAGFVDGVQGVYLGRASAQAVPTLLARDAQYPSISADGNLVAMVHCVPTSPGEGPRFLWESNPFRENARVRILSTGDGTSQEVDFGKNVIVCGTRYVENPRRLLVTGMRTQDDGKAVWWVIWSVGSDGVATELRSWKFGEGMLIDA
jgi:hypothetical protein